MSSMQKASGQRNSNGEWSIRRSFSASYPRSNTGKAKIACMEFPSSPEKSGVSGRVSAVDELYKILEVKEAVYANQLEVSLINYTLWF